MNCPRCALSHRLRASFSGSTSWPSLRGNATAYQSSVASPASSYPVTNAFDDNPGTFVHTACWHQSHDRCKSTAFNVLDNGFAWFLLDFDVQSDQIIKSVSMSPRVGAARSLSYAVEVFISNSLSKTPSGTFGMRGIPWGEFMKCGTTASSTSPSDLRVNCNTVRIAHSAVMR